MNLIDQLRRDEGLRLVPYRDTRGNWTVGYGHKLDAHREPIPYRIDQQQADQYLYSDAEEAIRDLSAELPWTGSLDPVRRAALENMTFQLGINGLLEFHRTLAMVQAGNYDGAGDAMLESAWAMETTERARRLSAQMKTGEWQ